MRKQLAAALVLVVSGCAQEPVDGLSSNRGDLTWEEFLTYVYQEPDTGVYIANGDELFETEEELRELYHALNGGGDLIVNLSGGADDRWCGGTEHNLTYCVSTSFGDQYDAVVAAMASATAEWSAAADVQFVHDASADGSCTNRNNGVVFNVRPVNSGCQYLARAFFPHSSRKSREILVDWCAFSYGDSPSVTGVLRHELGHTIGFRHEHTRPESGVCFEDNNWRELTPYDVASVMHYPQCNGTGTWELLLTDSDRAGAAALYGAPGAGIACADGGGGGGECLPDGASCTTGSECCSLTCGGKPGSRTCR